MSHYDDLRDRDSVTRSMSLRSKLCEWLAQTDASNLWVINYVFDNIERVKILFSFLNVK